MNVQAHLLSVLGEEGAEIAQDCSKINRFGIYDCDPTNQDAPTNGAKLVHELNDLLGTVRLLVIHKILPENWQSETEQILKMNKIERFMGYARQLGTLE